MELKEFITNALTDITGAIKDCQQNVDNGAIFAPTNTKADNRINTPNGELSVFRLFILRLMFRRSLASA